MAKSKRAKTKESVIAKYEKKIRKVINKNWDKTMEELWKDLDELEEQMAVELAEFGIPRHKPVKITIPEAK